MKTTPPAGNETSARTDNYLAIARGLTQGALRGTPQSYLKAFVTRVGKCHLFVADM